MKKSKKIFFAMAILAFLFFIGMSTYSANAKGIRIKKDINVEGVTLYSLSSKEYAIIIDDETNIGYVVCTLNGVEQILGTCKVVVIDLENPDGYALCESDDNSYGELTIVVTDETTKIGYVENVTDELAIIFEVNDQVVLEN